MIRRTELGRARRARAPRRERPNRRIQGVAPSRDRSCALDALAAELARDHGEQLAGVARVNHDDPGLGRGASLRDEHDQRAATQPGDQASAPASSASTTTSGA